MRLIKQENEQKELTFTPKIITNDFMNDSRYIIQNGEPIEVLKTPTSRRRVHRLRSTSTGRHTMPLSLNLSDGPQDRLLQYG